jgi:hypothetical protein
MKILRENDPNIKEGNENYFVYPQNLYLLLLQKKDVNIEFIKPFDMNIKTYNFEETMDCCAIYYSSPNVGASILVLLNLNFYPDRLEIGGYPAKAFPKMIKYLYRLLVHIFFHHSNLFNTRRKIKNL